MLRVQGIDLSCKLDCEMQANVRFIVTYEELQKPPALRQTSSSLAVYNNHRIKPLGVATLAVDIKRAFEQLDFYIVSHEAATIFSLPSFTQLDLFRRLDTDIALMLTAMFSDDLLKAYIDVFDGLGRIQVNFILCCQMAPC